MPVNYQMDVINPFQAALQGYGAGAQMLQQERTAERQVRQDEQQSQLFGLQMQEAQARAAKLQQEIKAAQERDTVYGEFYDAVEAGKLTPELVAKVTALDEKLGTFGADMMANVTTEQKKASFANLMAPATALATGDVEAAKANLQTQYDALVNAGDEQGATAVKGYLDQLSTPQGQTFVQAALLRGASMMEPDEFKKQLENITALKGEKETEAVTTARAYASTFGPPGSPEYMRAFQTKLLPPPAPGTVVNVGATGKPLSIGQEAVDKKFADTYAEFVTGGAADAARQIGQLNEALVTLKTNKEITGPLVGIIPENLQSFVVPEAAALRQTVQDVVQRSLKAILGTAFTQKDAEGLMARAFDPALKPEENTKRVERLLTQIDRANSDTQAAVDYFEKNGTLQGFKYNAPRLSDFEAAASGKGPAPAAAVNFGAMDDRTLTGQDISKLTREQRAALSAELDKRGL
jgi:hypothetical protein